MFIFIFRKQYAYIRVGRSGRFDHLVNMKKMIVCLALLASCAGSSNFAQNKINPTVTSVKRSHLAREIDHIKIYYVDFDSFYFTNIPCGEIEYMSEHRSLVLYHNSTEFKIVDSLYDFFIEDSIKGLLDDYHMRIENYDIDNKFISSICLSSTEYYYCSNKNMYYKNESLFLYLMNSIVHK